MLSLKAFLITGLAGLLLSVLLLWSTNSLLHTRSDLKTVREQVTILQTQTDKFAKDYADLQSRLLAVEKNDAQFKSDLNEAFKRNPQGLGARAADPVIDVLCKRLRCTDASGTPGSAVPAPAR